MKTFLVLLKEKTTAPLDEKLLHQHIQHLKQLNRSGHLLICGPFEDGSGGMLVVQANALSDANALIQSDPFIQQGYYGDYSITSFYLAEETNNYLSDHEQTMDELKKP